MLNNNTTTYISWRLNEKHYGSLEGVPRQYVRIQYGDRFTQMMRNNFYMKPPVLTDIPHTEEYSVFKNCYFDSIKYGESKENVLNRLLPYFQNDILYSLSENYLPIVVTHKHCLRVLMKHYLNISDNDFENYTIPDKSVLIMFFNKKYKFTGHNFIYY
jgi:2,3-bisphosphoglycerate-dependent phosphoglycerate mutase